jgi:type IV pilus assembly protein PilV
MLSLAAMMSYAVQMPKLAAHRATATILAAGHVERMRANPTGFISGDYVDGMTFNTTLASVTPCTYPNCTSTSIAALDKNETNTTIRALLPQGGMRVICKGGDCTLKDGDLWVIWQEPDTSAALNATNTDECPDPTGQPAFTAFTSPLPRCLHVRFHL